MIAEGEPATEALWRAGIPAVGTVTGASGCPSDDVLRVLADRRVILWPDADTPGRAHMQRMATRMQAIGVTALRVVEWPDAPAGGDAADYRGDLRALLQAAPLWQPSVAAGDLALTGIGDLLAEPEEMIDWLVDERFACGSINLLAGKPKAGKSTLARYLAFCIATGTPFLEHRCISGPVWYLVLEDKRSEVRRHFRALGATGREPVRFLFGATADLIDKLAHMAARERPACIVVDTMQRLVNAKDLNDYAEVTRRLDPVLTIARTTGAAIVLVHHAGKAERAGLDSVLGSTALAGSVDNIFLLNRTERYRVLSSVQRIGPDLPETVITLDPTGHARGGQSRHDADVAFMQAAMLDALRGAGQPMTRAEWFDAVEGRKQVKLEALRRLLDVGTTITRTGAGNRWDPYRYSSGSEVPSSRWEPPTAEPLVFGSSNVGADLSGSQVPVSPGSAPEPVDDSDERPYGRIA